MKIIENIQCCERWGRERERENGDGNRKKEKDVLIALERKIE